MDSHFNGYKARYDLLDRFMRPITTSQIVRSMNIFVQLDDLFHILHNPLINNEFQICGSDAGQQLLQNVFNLLGHYRYWAIKQKYDVKVYGIYTTALRSFKNNVYIPDYRKHFKQINAIENTSCFFVNTAIQAATPTFPILAKFIPDVYLINSKYLEPSMIPLYLSGEWAKMDWNILVSRDSYDLQYAYRNKWTLISPKGENSTAVNQQGIWNYVNIKERVFKEEKNLNYPYELFILAKAIVGDRYRSIPRLRRIGWKTLFKKMDQIIDENPDASITTLKVKLIENIQGRSDLSTEAISNNLNAINIEMQKDTMLELDRSLINDQLIDVPDYGNLQEFNRIQLKNYQLNLQFLTNVNYKSTPFD